MPVSKKPRPKAKATKSAAPLVPTRRMREAYWAAATPETRTAELAEADAILLRGVDSGFSRSALAAAHRALAVSPLCAEAYRVLADEAGTDEAAIDLTRRAVHAGELALGPEMFEGHAGSFWAMPETRPYMGALFDLAVLLLANRTEDDDKPEEQAVAALEALLRLNPNDDQGARYPLLAYYLDLHDLEPARALIEAFADDATTTWLYSRALLAYRDEQQNAPSTRALIQAALTANPHVPAILAETKPDAFADPDEPIPPGSPEEATEYVAGYETGWSGTPGAVAWLLSQAG